MNTMNSKWGRLAKNSGGFFYLFEHIAHISAQARKKDVIGKLFLLTFGDPFSFYLSVVLFGKVVWSTCYYVFQVMRHRRTNTGVSQNTNSGSAPFM